MHYWQKRHLNKSSLLELKIYHTATPKKYDFLYLNLTENPPQAWHNFEKMIAVGGQKNENEGIETNLQDNQNKKDEIKINVDTKK